jgi:sterol desaturase/sphingolipid hydroxylase (fatty acid hydroxylase superfamily)
VNFEIKNKGQKKLFHSPVLERLSKSTPELIALAYLPALTIMMIYCFTTLQFSWQRFSIYFFSGLLFWTFFEYIMHRYIFHFISDNPRMQKLQYTIHGVHHEYPRDRDRLLMPPVVGIIISTLIFFALKTLFSENTFAFFPGFMCGYLAYGMMHYAIHSMKPPFEFLKRHWRNHSLHHYKHPDLYFGVSSPLWDYIFGTYSKK